MRTLVGVATNPSNNNKDIISAFKSKLAQYITSISLAHISPAELMTGYKVFWQLSIYFIAPALTLPPTSNILCPFHRNLLLRLGINRNIPKELIEIPIYMGGFEMKSLEMKQYIELIGLMISYLSFYNQRLDTILPYFYQTIINYHFQ